MTFVNFVRKLEGKPERVNHPEVVFPEVWDLELFRFVCVIGQSYSPGETIEDTDFRDAIFNAFDWNTSHVSADLWDQLHEESYMHPECHKALTQWYKAMKAGQIPEETPF